MNEKNKIFQRTLVINIARKYKKSGFSKENFLEMVDICGFNFVDINDAVWALKERGELKHLIEFVWEFTRK